MWEFAYKESWMLKNWCFWTVVLEKNFESPLDCKEFQQVHPKGDQSWIFIGRTDVEAETPILWPPEAINWITRKDPDAEKDWGQEENGDDKGWDGWMASPTQQTWVWVNSGSWWTGRPGMLQSMESKESDMTERLNWTERSCETGAEVHLPYHTQANTVRSCQLKPGKIVKWVSTIRKLGELFSL